MSMNRRNFIKRGAIATTLVAATAMLPRPLHASRWSQAEAQSIFDDPQLKELAARALDAARKAGASYADVRLTHSWQRGVLPNIGISDTELLDVGVRALVDGYWGFASSPIWNADEMVRLGREAYHQGKANALTKPREIELAPAPPVANGQWIMPIKIDPFELNPVEVLDYLESLSIYVLRKPNAGVQSNSCSFAKQETVFASTAGSYISQRRYRSEGNLQLTVGQGQNQEMGALDCLSPSGVGWELYKGQPIRDKIDALIAELEWQRSLPVMPVDVGRYDMVIDAEGIGDLLLATLVGATELDRAMGYEANATGTSYLNEPLAMVGTQQVSAPLLTVSGNRSENGGCATTQWDDEGITPDTFTFINNGLLSDFQTTRESAGWLNNYYQRSGMTFRSHGCAAALRGVYAPLLRTPNIAMRPGSDSNDFDTLVGTLSEGIAFKHARTDVDFQNLNGIIGGQAYEVKNGKIISRLSGAGVLFRSPELWKNLMAIGGEASTRRFGKSTIKGQPTQEHFTSVSTVPGVFKQQSLIDQLRKA